MVATAVSNRFATILWPRSNSFATSRAERPSPRIALMINQSVKKAPLPGTTARQRRRSAAASQSTTRRA